MDAKQVPATDTSVFPAENSRSIVKMLLLAYMLLALAVILGILAYNSTLSATSSAAAAPQPPNTLWAMGIVLLWLLTSISGLTGLVLLAVSAIRWAIAPLEDSLQKGFADLTPLLTSLNERLLISETAKRIVYREKDRQVLRQAIQEDVNKGDIDGALVLINQMGETYGYHEEAEVLRAQISQEQTADVNRKIDSALARLDDLLASNAWDKAYAEVGRIQRTYPHSPRVQNLEQRVRQAYDTRKSALERQFLAAAERDDVDLALELMKQLDRYLSEKEAEPYRETARGVIGKKRDNLGVQFKLSLQDKEWSRALEVGQQIIREFPNTKMAQEVRDMLDLLRQRTAEQTTASALSSPSLRERAG
ncbi:MAG: hypothetical protein IT443_05550 [Phycisphaeraceae bacterium]|nr:hypothetical protein [Phycisphaeraceae bacterium]